MKASLALLALLAFLGGCASQRSLTQAVELKEDLFSDRVIDVIRVKKIIGQKNYLIFKKNKYSYFLEGYIQGIITDYDGNPVSGLEVRAEMIEAMSRSAQKGAEELILTEEPQAQVTAQSRIPFDPGLTDAQGIYRVRFNLPIIKGRVDVWGKLLYNPSWAQQHDVLGQAYEPQTRESEFRLYYDGADKILVLAEGLRKTIVRPVRNVGKPVSPMKLPGSAKPETITPLKKEKKEEDEFFKSFQFPP